MPMWLNQNPELATRFMMAMLRANRWLYEPTNKKKAVEILIKYTKLSPKHADLAYDAYLTTYKAISLDGSIRGDGFEQTQKVMVELGQLDRTYPTADFVDTAPLERALQRVKAK